MDKNYKDRITGCLFGSAIGDALGYPIEFMRVDEILLKYKGWLKDYDTTKRQGVALISDDTQMTIFTLVGLLTAWTMSKSEESKPDFKKYLYESYLDWTVSQHATKLKEIAHAFAWTTGELVPKGFWEIFSRNWTQNIPSLIERRGPGKTCLSLNRETKGTIVKPTNDSKGCGGIMRVSPVAIILKLLDYSQNEIDLLGAESSAITHGHELGYIPSAMLVHILSKLFDGEDLKNAVLDSIDNIQKLFPKAKHLSELIKLINLAINLSEEDIADIEAIMQLGEGWVAEETLAIAIYSALKHKDNFEEGIVCAINHDGDSDSTGCVCGAILGASLGFTKIPQRYVQPLEVNRLLVTLIKDIFDLKEMLESKPESAQELIRNEKWAYKYFDRIWNYPIELCKTILNEFPSGDKI